MKARENVITLQDSGSHLLRQRCHLLMEGPILISVLSALWMGVAVPEGPQSIALPGGGCEGQIGVAKEGSGHRAGSRTAGREGQN